MRTLRLSCVACCLAAAAGCGGTHRSTDAARPTPKDGHSTAAGAVGASAPFVRVPASRARPRPRQIVLAVAQLGLVRARCGSTGPYLVSYTPKPPHSETVRISAGGKTLKANIHKSLFLSFPAPRQTVGREVVAQTPVITLVLDANHEPFEARVRASIRIADARDGTHRCAATSLHVTGATRFH